MYLRHKVLCYKDELENLQNLPNLYNLVNTLEDILNFLIFLEITHIINSNEIPLILTEYEKDLKALFSSNYVLEKYKYTK